MAQPILKRRLNPLLLISTVAALSLLAGVSVLYQDQISQRGDRLNQVESEKNELNNTIDRLEAEKQNQTVEINRLEDRIDTLNTEKDSLNDTIQQRNQEISNLESQLDEAQRNSASEERVESLNTSLGVMCSQISPSNVGVNQCDDHGHSIGGQ